VQAQPELLSNPDLDATSVSTMVLPTPTGWDAAATRAITGPDNDGMSSEGFANVLQPAGSGLFFKPFRGDVTNGDITASLTQTVPGTPGLPYTLRGWAGAGDAYIGLTDPTVSSLFRIDFLNAGATLISSATLDLRGAGLGVGPPTPPATGFHYHLFQLTALAPAGTAFVRAGAHMIDAFGNPAGGDQAFVVDSFSLKVPEPGSFGLVCVSALALMSRRRKA
jgi:hypothetical protein